MESTVRQKSFLFLVQGSVNTQIKEGKHTFVENKRGEPPFSLTVQFVAHNKTRIFFFKTFYQGLEKNL